MRAVMLNGTCHWVALSHTCYAIIRLFGQMSIAHCYGDIHVNREAAYGTAKRYRFFFAVHGRFAVKTA